MPQPPEASLDDWLAYLERLHASAIDLGLDRLVDVAARLTLPLAGAGRDRPFVSTVAGTNGKGSTCETLRQLALTAGARVGLYSSPHLHRFNERVIIDDVEVDDATLIAAFETVEAARGDTSLTYFEFTTLAAFVVFAAADLDVWVLEVGLGGRLDAVNLVDADVAVITTVDLDHQAFLGDDRDGIGREKAGIVRAGRPVVLGSPDLPASVTTTAEAAGARIHRYGDRHGADDGRLWWSGGALAGEVLASGVPPANQASALQAFALSPWSLAPAEVARALSRVRLPGRLQTLRHRGRRLVLDVGHNPHAARYLAAHLAGERYSVVLAMLADKDVEGVAAALAPLAGGWYLAGLGGPRGLDSEALRARATGGEGGCYHSVAAALEAACAEETGRPVLVCGSFFTVAEALDALGTASPME